MIKDMVSNAECSCTSHTYKTRFMSEIIALGGDEMKTIAYCLPVVHSAPPTRELQKPHNINESSFSESYRFRVAFKESRLRARGEEKATKNEDEDFEFRTGDNYYESGEG